MALISLCREKKERKAKHISKEALVDSLDCRALLSYLTGGGKSSPYRERILKKAKTDGIHGQTASRGVIPLV